MIERKINSVGVTDRIAIITIQKMDSKDISLFFNEMAEKSICVSITNCALGNNGKLNLCFAFADKLLGNVMSCIGKSLGNDFVYSVSADNSQIVFEIEDVTAVDKTLCHILKAMNDAGVCVKLINASVNKIYVIVNNIDIDKAMKVGRKLIN